MKRTTQRRSVAAAAAVILTAIILPAFVAAQGAQAPAQPANAPAEQSRLSRTLGLTPEQEKALVEFRQARREESRAFRDEMAKVRGEMRELAKDPEANQAKLDALIDKTAKLRAERIKAAFRTRAERDKIFTPEQLAKMKTLRSRMEGRLGRTGRVMRRLDRAGMRGPGRLMGPGPRLGRMARLRALRHSPFFRWRRW